MRTKLSVQLPAERTPESIKSNLSSDQYKIYKLIWERFMASQMSSAEILTRTVEIGAGIATFQSIRFRN